MSLNTIREVTEITGITVNALRYYDNKGLLHPTVRNQEGKNGCMMMRLSGELREYCC